MLPRREAGMMRSEQRDRSSARSRAADDAARGQYSYRTSQTEHPGAEEPRATDHAGTCARDLHINPKNDTALALAH